MGDNRNFAALDWVVGEIGETLKLARQALEAYVENSKDAARIGFCLTHIHQVHGSLKMVEFYGAALMAEEMEQLAQALMNNSVKNEAEGQEVLMRAILQLPLYLEHIKAARKDQPAMVLPLLNDLRAVRGESLLTETQLFNPDMSAARTVRGEMVSLTSDGKQFVAMIAKLRQMYQYAAASLIRGVNPEESLAYLEKVFSRLQKLTQGTLRQPLWDVALALVEGLQNDSVEASVSVKNLLRQLDREIKVLEVHGVKALKAGPSDELLKNLLYYIARAETGSAQISIIKQRYRLDEALPSENQKNLESEDVLGGPDGDAMRSVVAAIGDELDIIKHSLDMCLSGEDVPTHIKEALPVLKRVADTLAVLGLGSLRQKLLEQNEILERALSSPESLTPDVLMSVAGEIISLENNLQSVSINNKSSDPAPTRDININQAQEQVLRECRNGLEQAKDAVIEYIASHWEQSHLGNVPNLLREIRGGLDMIPLNRPARIIGACARFVDEKLLVESAVPDWSTLDTLADAITSVEYYLERLSGDFDEDDDLLLSVAEESVETLGYAVASTKSKLEAAAAKSDVESVLKKMVDVEDVDMNVPVPAAEEDASEAPAVSGETKAEQIQAQDEAEEIEFSLQDSTESNVSQSDTETEEVVEVEEELEDEIDEEILEIFVEEAEEVLETINEYFPRWKEDSNDQESLTEFRRAFHTLKGSGRMVKAMDIGELAWSVESLLNRILEGSVNPESIHVDLIERVLAILPSMVEAFSKKLKIQNRPLVDQYIGWADELGKGNFPAELLAGVDEPQQPLVSLSQEAIDESIEDEAEPDSLLWEIFGSEATTHLEVVDNFIAEMVEQAPLYTPPSEEMQRALHTLKGSAHMADVASIAELATPLERFVKELRSYQVNIDEDILQLLKDCVTYTREALHLIASGSVVEMPRLQQFVARVAELKERSVGQLIRQQEAQSQGKKKVDPELLSIFMAEEMNLLLEAEKMLAGWRANDVVKAEVQALKAELANLERGADHANLSPMSELSGQLKSIYQALNNDQLTLADEHFTSLLAGHEALLDMVDAVAAGQNLLPIPADIKGALQVILPAGSGVDSDSVEQFTTAEDSLAVADQQEDDEDIEFSLPSDEEEAAFIEAVVEPVVAPAAKPTPVPPPVVQSDEPVVSAHEEEEVDPEIFEIFLEEADELLEEIDVAINGWEDDWSNTQHTEELKRILHTLKGGARLAGLKGLGDISHDFETYLISREGSGDADAALFDVLHNYQDLLLNGTDKVRKAVANFEPAGLAEAMRNIDNQATQGLSDIDPKSEPAAGKVEEADAVVEAKPKKIEPVAKLVSAVKPATALTTFTSADIIPFNTRTPAPSVLREVAIKEEERAASHRHTPQLAVKRNQPQEVVKISADLLEELVNLAGETSISRGRMEEQVSEIGFAVEEMEATIMRLQEQLRRLDIETEAQVIFRQEQLSETEDFDPLEMDRYSQLQQLSRSLIESASDLLDLKSTLNDKTRDAETLLLQQSRINTDLQEGLMRSRMVPFSRLVPRLRRIVRQVSTELDKQVNFELENAEGEMDRSVLERMVAPLEHMLRNAVDHGIEDTAGRKAAGKPAEGRVVLSLGREGGDVVLRLADDGRGINLDRVKQKALERGLMTADAKLSDQDIMQFILSAGFSTAEHVTQISGRGVGMDVVHSEIKLLGGSMFIDSHYGSGTEFVIRLPFTVSVNRALMVLIGEDRYAIPLNTIEGIVRVSPFELEHYYQDTDARFEYAGENYRVRYLGNMLNRELRPKLEGHALPLPVILVRSAEHVVALQVDTLMGSREIVVKTLGQQFSSVHGLSGATVMGDGSVVVILDLHAMIRKEAALSLMGAQPLQLDAEVEKEEVAKLVMVVDDSVTVRKVTTRFLEREGYNVITAKDGADALRVLQDTIPDVMLLDIEMPRMDGFEVAKNIRSSSRLKHIPIIMITSRTGDKHRERAFSLGVNKYMGKPYQEDALLANIQELGGESS